MITSVIVVLEKLRTVQLCASPRRSSSRTGCPATALQPQPPATAFLISVLFPPARRAAATGRPLNGLTVVLGRGIPRTLGMAGRAKSSRPVEI